MLSIKLQTPEEIAKTLAERVRVRRLHANLSQAGLAERAGISLGSLKRFERTGEIALVSLLRLAGVLDAVSEFDHLFPDPSLEPATIDEVLERKTVRRRGRLR